MSTENDVTIVVYESKGIEIIETNFTPLGGSGGGGGGTGPQGPAGPSGSIGPMGLQGIQGPSGSVGATGASGSSGVVPIKKDGSTIVNVPVGLDFIGSGYAVTNNANTAEIRMTGVLSGSAQVDYSSIQNKPTTIPTASVGLTVPFTGILNAPTFFTSSGQVDYNSIQNKPTMIPTASISNAVQYTNVLNKPTIFSGSAQVDYTSIQNKPTTIASASLATTASFVSNAISTTNIAIQNVGILSTGYATSFDIPANCFLNKIRIRSNSSGSVVVDLRQSTQATFGTGVNAGTSITGSTPLSMSNNQTYTDTTLTGWARNLYTDDVLSVIVKAVSGSSAFNGAVLSLYLVRV